MNNANGRLQGCQLLIVEDEYFLAQDLADYFQNLGANIVGPAGSVADALRLLDGSQVQGAILDVNLKGERVYPVADVLRQKGVSFVFASGYGGELEPPAYADIPRCLKPVDPATVAKTLVKLIGERSMLKLC